MTPRPLILQSNDDGVTATGLLELRSALQSFADVVTVAPETNQSAQSHSITLDRPLRHTRVGDTIHAVDGTPADCVYVGLEHASILPRPPDFVVAGINHGPNLGSDVYYSGTVAAAREGALRGYPSLAVSAGDASDMTRVAATAAKLIESFTRIPLPEGEIPLININFPPEIDASYKGVRVTRLGRRQYGNEVIERVDPRGKSYYWIGSAYAYHEHMENSDTEAVDEGYISVTPLMLDGTCSRHFGVAAFLEETEIP